MLINIYNNIYIHIYLFNIKIFEIFDIFGNL